MRRRRRRFTWFPVNGTGLNDDSAEYDAAPFVVNPFTVHANTAADGPAFTTFPIVPDYSEFSRISGESEATLRDQVEGQEWLLKRIVGKICLHTDVTLTQAGGDSFDPSVQWAAVLVSVGIFVARAQDSNQALIDMQAASFDVMSYENSTNPWLFRRTWLLSPNYIGSSGTPLEYYRLPTSTYTGSVAEGTHIDSKVARRINREHRLWLIVSAMGGDAATPVSVAGTDMQQPQVQGIIDLRVLGALRKAKNKSSF